VISQFIMANTSGEKELKTDWPIETGLTAETTKQAGTSGVLEFEDTSFVQHWGSI
jgi:hypothetical protein